MKKFNLLFVIFFLGTTTAVAGDLTDYLASITGNQNYSKSKLTSLEITQIKTNIVEIFDAAAESREVYDGFTPVFLRDDYNDIAYSLYNDGLLKLLHYENFEKNYEALGKLKVPSKIDPKIFWKQQYVLVFNKLLSSMESDPETCATVGENATVRKCCRGLVKSSAVSQNKKIIDYSKKSSGEKCSKQSDCQSGLCVKSDLDQPGICTSVKSCFELQELGGDCSGDRPICAVGNCVRQDKGNLGIGECSARDKVCSENSECCSSNCSNNKCVDSYKCLSCVGSGAKPIQGETCCPGTYLAPSGKCQIIFRPLVPLVQDNKTSFFKVLLSNIFISSASAQSTNEITENTTVQPEEVKVDHTESYANIKSKFNMPAVFDKTYSDIKKCEFKSFNDNWKAASNTERNAELFLRSFEFTFSGSGTQDYWEEKGKGNIFKRANKVALAIRANRGKMIARASAIDKEMSCKCIAIFGPQEFEQERQDYFVKNCAAEAASLRSSLSTNGDSNIDGTSITSDNDLEQSQARIEEIDKGALGLSHEKLLIEYLDLRSQAQMDRFVDNEALAKELTELSSFISGTDFEEVWKDQVSGDSLSKNNPQGDSRLLYKWGFKYLGGLLALLVIIAFVAVGALLGPFIVGAFGLGTIVGTGAVAVAVTGGAAGLVTGFLVSALLSGFGGKATPGAFDLKKVKKGKYNLLYKFDGFEKWYVGPRFSNQSSNSDTKCDVFAKASACLKSAYAFNDSSMNYLKSIPSSGHFIVDPKVPPFVNPTLIATKGMPVYGKTWMKIMNETVNEGVAYLQSTKPSGKTKKGYTITKKSFAKRDIMQEAMSKKYFLPMRGNVSVKIFDQRKAITDAAFKYAMCKELNSGTCVLAGAGQGEFGLGYLFESETEAKEWAEYTYEMHYIYSSVTKDTYMGYPLLGADVYFQAVAYNMKLVASISANRSRNYAQASNLYQQDWDRRANDYQSLGEATLGLSGDSTNIRYTPAFFEAFEALNFSGQTQIEGFDAKIDSASKGSGFNASELSALSAGRRQAVRINADIASAKTFDDTIGKTSEARNRLASVSDIGAGLFSNGISDKNSSSSANKVSIKDAALANSLNINSNTIGNDKLDASNSGLSSKSKSNSLSSGASSLGIKGSGAKSFSGIGYNANYGDNYGDFEDGAGDAKAHADSNRKQLKDQGMSAQAADDLISALNKESSNHSNLSGESESIFNVVSQAYKRNYSRMLVGTKDFVKKDKTIIKPSMSGGEKDEIRALLEKTE